jgi:hypothetical protein
MPPRKKVTKKRTPRKVAKTIEVPTVEHLVCQSGILVRDAREVADSLAANLRDPLFIRKYKGNSIVIHTYSGIIRILRSTADTLEKEATKLENQSLIKNSTNLYKKSMIEKIERLNNNVKMAR